MTKKETIKDGLVEEFYDNDQLRIKRNYNNGKLQGPFEMFYVNGQIKIRSTYKKGKRDGLWEYFDLDGNLIGNRRF